LEKMDKEEKRNKRTGFLVSLFVHLGLLVLFIFMLAWKEPYPPLPEYGIELNFGFDAMGEGIEESEQPSNEEAVEEEVPDEVLEESEENEDDTESAPAETVEEISEEIEAEAVEESTSEISATESKISQEVVEDKNEEKIAEEEKKPSKKEEPKVLVTYKPGGNKSEGDTKGVGNMGDPEGNKDSKNYEGNLGGGGGATLHLSGWKWEKEPNPIDKSDATGRIIFEITVDRNGNVKYIKTLEKTVSPIVEKIYREELRKTKFLKTGAGGVAEQMVGKVVFTIKAS
jgi:periplasmic protein TonB